MIVLVLFERPAAHLAGRQRRAHFRRAQGRDVNDLERRGHVAQQPVRPCGVARGQHESVAARRQRRNEIAQHRAKSGEALERPELEELVEQERRRRVTGRARRVEKGERGVERIPCGPFGRVRRTVWMGGEWRRRA